MLGAGGQSLYSGNSASKYQQAVNSRGKGVGQGGVAALQSGVPPVNSVQMPSWLNTNPDANLRELLDTYSGISSAFDPSGQVQARNDAIGYNTSAGTQNANNAATEYANRASQSGASSLGAGVVKAQAMLPILAQNSALKTDAADIAAKSHKEGIALAGQISSTISSLRNSYLQSLTGYTEGQQRLQTQNNQFNAGMGLDQQKFNYMQQQDYLQRSDRQNAMALAGMNQNQAYGAGSHPTSSMPRSTYTVRPTGLGAYTNVGFADSFLGQNQGNRALY